MAFVVRSLVRNWGAQLLCQTRITTETDETKNATNYEWQFIEILPCGHEKQHENSQTHSKNANRIDSTTQRPNRDDDNALETINVTIVVHKCVKKLWVSRCESRSRQRTPDIPYFSPFIILYIIMGRCLVLVDATGKCVNNSGVYWNAQFYKWLSGRRRWLLSTAPAKRYFHIMQLVCAVVVSSSFSMNAGMRQSLFTHTHVVVVVACA